MGLFNRDQERYRRNSSSRNFNAYTYRTKQSSRRRTLHRDAYRDHGMYYDRYDDCYGGRQGRQSRWGRRYNRNSQDDYYTGRRDRRTRWDKYNRYNKYDDQYGRGYGQYDRDYGQYGRDYGQYGRDYGHYDRGNEPRGCIKGNRGDETYIFDSTPLYDDYISI